MLDIKGLSVTFNKGTVNEVQALKDINFSLGEGKFVCVLGTNGSGKSTLLHAISGTHMPEKGKVFLGGRDLTHLKEHARARFIGKVFQNPFLGTAPEMSIAENLALAAKRGFSRHLRLSLTRGFLDQVREHIKELRMGLEDRLDTPIGMLSGGQRQALTLLMACWNRPDLLLLDEHTAALDPKTASMVIRLTEEFVNRHGLTTLMVTHSMQQAIAMGDQIIMMHKGKIVCHIKMEEKQHLKERHLLNLFEDVKRKDHMDESVAGLILKQYV